MATSDEVDAAALASALGPKKVQAGDDIVEQHDIDSLIKLSNHLQDQQVSAGAALVPGFGMRFTRVIGTPGGGG